jgi:hypothetical protein
MYRTAPKFLPDKLKVDRAFLWRSYGSWWLPLFLALVVLPAYQAIRSTRQVLQSREVWQNGLPAVNVEILQDKSSTSWIGHNHDLLVRYSDAHDGVHEARVQSDSVLEGTQGLYPRFEPLPLRYDPQDFSRVSLEHFSTLRYGPWLWIAGMLGLSDLCCFCLQGLRRQSPLGARRLSRCSRARRARVRFGSVPKDVGVAKARSVAVSGDVSRAGRGQNARSPTARVRSAAPQRRRDQGAGAQAQWIRRRAAARRFAPAVCL